MTKICFGCGAKLQSDNPLVPGYVPMEKLEDSVYCQRCFKLIHYGTISQSATPKDIKTIISSINNDDKFVIFLVDFLSINSEVINIFKSVKKSKLLLISKCDIIPQSINHNAIVTFVKNYYGVDSDVRLISSFKNDGITSLSNYLYYHNIKECYIVGLSNSGKSTLINKLMEVNNSDMHRITTSYIPNTTLDFIRLQVNDDLLVIDSPGFIIPSINDMSIIKKNNIKTFIKPKTFQMKANEILVLENMFIKFSSNTSATLYMANDLITKKYFKDVGEGTKLDVPANSDLIINGLGFINIKKPCQIEVVNIPYEIMELRNSIFGDNYE